MLGRFGTRVRVSHNNHSPLARQWDPEPGGLHLCTRESPGRMPRGYLWRGIQSRSRGDLKHGCHFVELLCGKRVPRDAKAASSFNLSKQSKHWQEGSAMMETLSEFALELEHGDHILYSISRLCIGTFDWRRKCATGSYSAMRTITTAVSPFHLVGVAAQCGSHSLWFLWYADCVQGSNIVFFHTSTTF
jgi:hypothetical protein